MAEAKRAHGVTPGLSRDYNQREATQQAAFLLPYLEPGLNLIDIGCGPGTITLGLAEAVAPGFAIGVDHDESHVAAARALALEHGRVSLTFERASAMLLPFNDESFDVAFENDMFVHLADRAVEAARQAFRVLKPGGLFAARDADASLAIWGHPVDDLPVLDGLMTAWQASRGSDINLGSRLPSILRQAGFSQIVKSVSADTKGDTESVRAHAEITVSLLDGPLGMTALREGWADQSLLDRVKASILAWSDHPEAFFANVHIEVIGWKSG
jgi:ubiquinone/menaquinone biosynthesis C-methylase UbiE